MKKLFCLLICTLLLLYTTVTPDICTALPANAAKKTTETVAAETNYAPDRIIIKLKKTARSDSALASAESDLSSFCKELSIDAVSLRLLNPSDKGGVGSSRNALSSVSDDSHNDLFVVTLGGTGESFVKNTLETLRKDPRVEYAVPDIIMQTCTVETNDPEYLSLGYQALRAIKAEQAWEITTGSDEVVVGILDSGIDSSHEDLKNNIWVNPTPNRNGYKNDIHGYNFVDECGGAPTDINGHGTHVSGIIGAEGNNDIGICGISRNVSLAWLGVADEAGNVALSDAVEAINYADNLDIPIINASWGGFASFNNFEDFRPLREAIAAYDGLILASSGNNGISCDTCPFYPASFDLPNIVSVGASSFGTASDPSNVTRAGFSNYGFKNVDLVAPGQDILSTWPDNKYEQQNGTSMAAPMATGVAALIKAEHPEYTAAQIKEALLSGTAKNGKFLVGSIQNGAALNAYGALLQTTVPPERMNFGQLGNSITVEAGQTLQIFANIFPIEADQSVEWSSSNPDVVRIEHDGKYFALTPGSAVLTAVCKENRAITKSVPITVTPAVSEIAEFTDKNFKAAYIYSLNLASSEYANGMRYIDSNIYLYETHNFTFLELVGTDVGSLEDLKLFPNTETLRLQGNVLKGTVDLTHLKKLKQVSIDAVVATGFTSINYSEGTYEYALKGVKAILGGKTVEATLDGDGFMEIDWNNLDISNNCDVSLRYKDFHRPICAEINGETVHAENNWISLYKFPCDGDTSIKLKIEPGLEISDPKLFQSIAEKLREKYSDIYWFYDWKDDYNLTEGDVAEFNYWKPICKSDLELLDIGDTEITSSRYTVANGKLSKIPEGTTAYRLLSGLNESGTRLFSGQKELAANDKVGTGMTAKLMLGDTVLQTVTLVVTGDVNGDGDISVTDMLAVKSHLLKKSTLSGVKATAADVSGDKSVSITDFIQIKAKILGKGTITAR